MQESNNIFDLDAKIDWAGGIDALVIEEGVYSIEDYDIPDDLKDAWQEMASCIHLVDRLMDLYRQDYDNNKGY